LIASRIAAALGQMTGQLVARWCLCVGEISALLSKGKPACPIYSLILSEDVRPVVSQKPNDQQHLAASLARRAASYSDVAPSDALVDSAFWGRTLWTDTTLTRMSLLPDTKRDANERVAARKRALKRA
jgi:hypothetical protein